MTDEPTQAIDMQGLTTHGEIPPIDTGIHPTETSPRDPFGPRVSESLPRGYKRVDMIRAFIWGVTTGCLIMLAAEILAAKL